MGATTLIDHCIESAEMPSTPEEFKKLLKEAKSAGFDQGWTRALNEAEQGLHEDRKIYNEEAVRHQLNMQEVKINYALKSALQKLQGVFRMPVDWAIVHDKIKQA